MPLVVLASHDFSDVPTGSTFHNDISRVKGAAITAGCGGGRYCPDDPVTRGQMAAFLSRTASRGAYDAGTLSPVPAAPTDLAVVTVRGSNVPGGTALVQLTGTFWVSVAYGNDLNCNPCEAAARIVQNGGGGSQFTYVQVFNQSASVSEVGSGAVTWMATIPTGQDVTFHFQAYRSVGTGTMNAAGQLSAIVVPLDGSGENPDLSAAAAPPLDPEDLLPDR